MFGKEESKQVLHFARICILAGYPLKQDNSELHCFRHNAMSLNLQLRVHQILQVLYRGMALDIKACSITIVGLRDPKLQEFIWFLIGKPFLDLRRLDIR
jgi:hypothetical protein